MLAVKRHAYCVNWTRTIEDSIASEDVRLLMKKVVDGNMAMAATAGCVAVAYMGQMQLYKLGIS